MMCFTFWSILHWGQVVVEELLCGLQCHIHLHQPELTQLRVQTHVHRLLALAHQAGGHVAHLPIKQPQFISLVGHKDARLLKLTLPSHLLSWPPPPTHPCALLSLAPVSGREVKLFTCKYETVTPLLNSWDQKNASVTQYSQLFTVQG